MAYDLIEDRSFQKKENFTYCSLDYLLKKSNVITIHLNLNKNTDGFIRYDHFKKMEKTPYLINVSRGEIIDEESLIKALKDGLIKGAGLDVFKNEPYFGELINYDNVILTPHIGAYAKEIRMKMEMEAVQNLIRGLNQE